MSEVAVRKCAAAEIFDDSGSGEMFTEYARECANPLLGATTPNRAQYEALEKAGCAQGFGAYREGRLAGFAFVLLSHAPHYAGVGLATVESLFVARNARSAALGLRLMEAVEDYAREAGCAAIFYSAPVGSRLERLLFLSADKYRRSNVVFTRRLR